MLRYKKFWLFIAWTYVFIVCYLSLMSNPPDLNIEFKYIDKLEHFIAYLILMTWFAQIYKSNKSRIYYGMFFITMGIVIEILQGLGQVRYFEFGDMFANTLGVVFAWQITKGKLKYGLLAFEEKILIKRRSL